jgi:hypothetical protein
MHCCEHHRIALLQTMQALDRFALQLNVPKQIFTNALLNCAIERLMCEQGQDVASAAFARLSALLAAGETPSPHQAIPLTGFNA